MLSLASAFAVASCGGLCVLVLVRLCRPLFVGVVVCVMSCMFRYVHHVMSCMLPYVHRVMSFMLCYVCYVMHVM